MHIVPDANTDSDIEEYIRLLPNDKKYLIIEFDADDIDGEMPDIATNTLTTAMLEGAVRTAVCELALKYCTGITGQSEDSVADWAFTRALEATAPIYKDLLKNIVEDHINDVTRA